MVVVVQLPAASTFHVLVALVMGTTSNLPATEMIWAPAP